MLLQKSSGQVELKLVLIIVVAEKWWFYLACLLCVKSQHLACLDNNTRLHNLMTREKNLREKATDMVQDSYNSLMFLFRLICFTVSLFYPVYNRNQKCQWRKFAFKSSPCLFYWASSLHENIFNFLNVYKLLWRIHVGSDLFLIYCLIKTELCGYTLSFSHSSIYTFWIQSNKNSKIAYARG